MKKNFTLLLAVALLVNIGVASIAGAPIAQARVGPSVIVAPGNLQGWTPANVRADASVALTQAQPHNGDGSLQFTTHTVTSGQDKADFELIWDPTDHPDWRLGDLSNLSFDFYRDSSSTTADHFIPVLRLYVYNPDTVETALLIWEGIYNGINPAPVDLWVPQDVLGGKFWMYVPGQGTVQNFNSTLADWISGSPVGQPGDPTPVEIDANTLVVGINVGVGSGWGNDFLGFVDDVVIGFGGTFTAYNFEPGPVCTTDCYVDAAAGNDANGGSSWADAKKTIQAGIDAVDIGGNVHVAAGTYLLTSPISVNKSVTILGPQGGVDPRPSAGTTRVAGDAATEAIVDGGGALARLMRIAASDVVVDGLEFRNATSDMIDSAAGAGISNVTLRYNIIRDALGDEGMQLRDCAGCLIEYNHVFDIAQDGINLCCGSTGGVIQFNEVHANSSENAAIYVYEATNTTIEGNLVYDVYNNDGIKLGSKSCGDASLGGGGILNNVVHDTQQDAIAVYMSDVTISGNEVYNSTSENGTIYVSCHGVDSVSVTENNIHDNGSDSDSRATYGVRIGKSSYYPTNVVVNNNCVTGNEEGLFYNASTNGVLNAEVNWWGAADGPSGAGPGTGDSVSSAVDVDFDPWQTAPIPGVCAPELGVINTVKYHDLNANGQRDEGEPGLAGWTITVTGEGGEWSDVTGEDGGFEQPGLKPGVYTICETLRDGWINSQPGDGLCYTETFTSGFDATFLFGNYQSGSLTVSKTVNWDGMEPTGHQFDICVKGPSFHESACIELGDGASKTWDGLIPGDYTVAEIQSSEGWTVEGAPVVVTVEPGGAAVVDVTNTYPPALCELYLNGEPTPFISTQWDGTDDVITAVLENLREPVSYHWKVEFPTDHGGTMVPYEGSGVFPAPMVVDLGGDMPRSNAVNQHTLPVGTGESASATVSITEPGDYSVVVRYSNDNDDALPIEVVEVVIDGESVGSFTSKDTNQYPDCWGCGWNVFATSYAGSVDLAAGAHTMTLTVSGGDGYGIELDTVAFTRGFTIPYPPKPWGTPDLSGDGSHASHVTLWIDEPCTDQNWGHWYHDPYEADLEITKTDAADPVAVTTEIAYTLTVTNHGPYNAEDVWVDDPLPAGVTLVSATPSQGTCDDTIHCELGDLTYLHSATIEVVVTANARGVVLNEAVVSAARPVDPNPDNNHDGEETLVKRFLTCVQAKRAGYLDYRLNRQGVGYVTNNSYQTYLFGVASYEEFESGDIAGQRLFASETFELAPGETYEFAIPTPECNNQIDLFCGEVRVPPFYDDDLLKAKHGGSDWCEAGDIDLQIEKTDLEDPVELGGTITYAITVTNAGQYKAYGVWVHDTLPAEVTLVSVTPSVGTCSDAIACRLGDILAGESATIEVVVIAPDAATVVTNTATVSHDRPNDPNQCNNTDSEDTTVQEPGGQIIIKKVVDAEFDDCFWFETFAGQLCIYPDVPYASEWLAPGTYSIAEDVPPQGWVFGEATCDDGSAPDAVQLDAGETVTCTFVNHKVLPGKIVIKKEILEGQYDGCFVFNTDFADEPCVYPGDNAWDSGDLDPGTYSISEVVPDGWTLDNVLCSDGSDPSAVHLEAGETVTCTFYNREVQPGRIVIQKEILEGQYDECFVFNTDFADEPCVYPGDNAWESNDLNPGTYSISEVLPDGWMLDNVLCSDGSDPSAIQLGSGETVTCTFYNREVQPGEIVIVKEVLDPFDGCVVFNTNFADAPCVSPDQPFHSDPLNPGAYSIEEIVPDGWVLDGASCDNGSDPSAIQLGSGETVTCTFVNRLPRPGKIVVKKEMLDSYEGCFNFTSNFSDESPCLGNGGSFESGDLEPGIYWVSEDLGDSGWVLDGATCDDGSAPDAIEVSEGETVTCTFVNRAPRPGKIVIQKETNVLTDECFTFLTDFAGEQCVFTDEPYTSEDLDAGTYEITEQLGDNGWQLVSATCDDGSLPGLIELGENETVTCTFVNRLPVPGKIIVTKEVVGEGTPDGCFNFTSNFADGICVDAGSSYESVELDAGTYWVSEDLSGTGWTLDSVSCDDGSDPSAIELGDGETVTCTFYNRLPALPGKIVIQKETNIPTDECFPFVTNFTDGLCVYAGQPFDSGDLPAGQYSVSESVPDGWELTGATCDDGSDPGAIQLGEGETVTCTFSNYQAEPGRIIVTKVTVPANDRVSFGFAPSYGAAFALKNGESNDSGDLPAGIYSVSESPADGWQLVQATCDDGSSPDAIDLGAGEVVTCTFVNAKPMTCVQAKRAGLLDTSLNRQGAGHVTNNSPFPYLFGVASYKEFEYGDIAGQELFASEQMMLGPGETWTFDIATPDCNTQIDLFCGEVRVPPFYDDDLLKARHGGDFFCPRDTDQDGIIDDVDNCLLAPNADQADVDQDGLGDACDDCIDVDHDGVCDNVDTCPLPNVGDTDGDGIDDACDDCIDVDHDGVCDNVDTCPLPNVGDSDGDGIDDACDACPFDSANDADGDGICGDVDGCPFDPNNDADGDGVCGDVDGCPFDPNNDADGDGICGDVDGCPFDPNNDADGDGICGDVDGCPFDPDNDADG
ncbi:MAG: DUF11 domain-containing protein, partial [Anaerolineae bacterium]|nr:DUF11 domain-containing protein [Anaerolineae bacterium]